MDDRSTYKTDVNQRRIKLIEYTKLAALYKY